MNCRFAQKRNAASVGGGSTQILLNNKKKFNFIPLKVVRTP